MKRRLTSIILLFSFVWMQSCGQVQKEHEQRAQFLDQGRFDKLPKILSFQDMVSFFGNYAKDEIDTDFLKENVAHIRESIDFAGHESTKSENLTRSIFEQWAILRLSSQTELEFMLQNYPKYLLLDPSLLPKEAIQKFDLAFPRTAFLHTPRLKKIFENVRASFLSTLLDRSERRKMRSFMMGVMQSVLVSRQALKAQERFFKARFASDDEKYIEGVSEIANLESQFQAYYPFLRTKSFMRDVLPYAHECDQVQNLQEKAVNQYVSRVEKFLSVRKNVPHLVEFLGNDALKSLSEDLVSAYESPEQSRFYSRVRYAYAEAVKEIRQNQETELRRIVSDLSQYPVMQKIIGVNVQSASPDTPFLGWLADRLTQSDVAWSAVEKYPFLLKGMDALNTHVHRHMRELSEEQNKRMTALTAVLLLSPVAGKKLNGTIADWMQAGKGTLGKVTRGALVATQLGLSASFYFDWKAAQNHYQDCLRLSMLSLDGQGLAELQRVHEALAASQLQKRIFLLESAMSGLMSFSMMKNQTWENILLPENSPVRLAMKSGWHLTPTATPEEWMARFRTELVGMQEQALLVRKKLGKGKWMPAAESGALVAGHMKEFSKQLVYLGTEMGFTLPGLLPHFVKSKVLSFPSDVWSGVLFGTVSAVMNVTFQIYINAAAVQSLVWMFEKSGLPSPTVLRVNALDFEYRTKRDAFLSIYGELVSFKSEFRYCLVEIAKLESNLQNTSVKATDAQRQQWRKLIDEMREAITEKLKIHLLRWYQRTEYRSIYASCFEDLNFGIKGEPSLADPTKLTVYLDIAGERLSYSATVEFLNSLRDREIGNFNLGEMSTTDAAHLMDNISSMTPDGKKER